MRSHPPWPAGKRFPTFSRSPRANPRVQKSQPTLMGWKKGVIYRSYGRSAAAYALPNLPTSVAVALGGSTEFPLICRETANQAPRSVEQLEGPADGGRGELGKKANCKASATGFKYVLGCSRKSNPYTGNPGRREAAREDSGPRSPKLHQPSMYPGGHRCEKVPRYAAPKPPGPVHLETPWKNGPTICP